MQTATSTPITTQSAEPGISRSLRWPWRVCAVLAVVLLFVANLEAWAYPNVADTSQFVGTTRDVLEREEVRAALATRIVDALLADAPRLQEAIGDTLTAIVTGLLGSERFQAVFSAVASQLQLALVHGERLSIVIESPELQAVVMAMIRILAPERADEVALDDGTLRIELFSDSVLPSYESEITILRWAGIAAGIVGLVLLALPYAVRRDRWSVRLAGLALMSTAVITFLVIVLANRIIDVQIDDRQLRTVVSNITDGFVGWLIAQTAIVLLIGIALCVYGFSLERWWRRLALRPVESATSTG
jgi:hypothetical protein